MSEQNATYTIYIMGKKYVVPAGLTIMKSIEYAGYQITRGCGCRGGVCGACSAVYRIKDSPKWHIGQACQVNAEDGMHLVQIPYIPAHRAKFDVHAVEYTDEHIFTALFNAYPTLRRCMGCNTCTNSCPVGLKVMDYVSAMLTGDFATAKHLSMECVMCGMCAMRCPAELSPMNMSMMLRRLMGKKAHKNTAQFAARLKGIRDGEWAEEIAKYKTLDRATLQPIYKQFQSVNRVDV